MEKWLNRLNRCLDSHLLQLKQSVKVYRTKANTHLLTLVFDKYLFKLNLYPVRELPWSKHLDRISTCLIQSNFPFSLLGQLYTKLMSLSSFFVPLAPFTTADAGCTVAPQAELSPQTTYMRGNINHHAAFWRKSRPIIRFRAVLLPGNQSSLRGSSTVELYS